MTAGYDLTVYWRFYRRRKNDKKNGQPRYKRIKYVNNEQERLYYNHPDPHCYRVSCSSCWFPPRDRKNWIITGRKAEIIKGLKVDHYPLLPPGIVDDDDLMVIEDLIISPRCYY